MPFLVPDGLHPQRDPLLGDSTLNLPERAGTARKDLDRRGVLTVAVAGSAGRPNTFRESSRHEPLGVSDDILLE